MILRAISQTVHRDEPTTVDHPLGGLLATDLHQFAEGIERRRHPPGCTATICELVGRVVPNIHPTAVQSLQPRGQVMISQTISHCEPSALRRPTKRSEWGALQRPSGPYYKINEQLAEDGKGVRVVFEGIESLRLREDDALQGPHD